MPTDFNGLVLGPSMTAFAAEVSWTPAGGSEITGLRGVLGDDYVEVDLGNEASMSTTSPVLGIRLSEWPDSPAPDDTITINAKTYAIWDTQQDGEGGLKLILKDA